MKRIIARLRRVYRAALTEWNKDPDQPEHLWVSEAMERIYEAREGIEMSLLPGHMRGGSHTSEQFIRYAMDDLYVAQRFLTDFLNLEPRDAGGK